MPEQIAFGACACGAYGQLFRTGKCAHCYIAELESSRYVPQREQALQAQVEAAREIINQGVEIMELHQVGQWEGVRAWLEQDTESYISSHQGEKP